MSIMNQDFNQQQYNDKLAQVASLAVTYAKDGTGYHSMKDAFNELCAISHANKGIDQENTIGRRTLLVQSVCIKAIHALTPYQNERLEQQLQDIASDYPEHRHLHFRRSFLLSLLSYHRHINESYRLHTSERYIEERP